MKFQHKQTREDGGGDLIVTAENKAEIIEVLKHFQVFDTDTPEGAMSLATALQGDTYTHTSASKKRPWFVTASALDWDFTKVYWDLLCKMTGLDDLGIPPDMDLTPFHPRRLCHTHITDRVWLEHGHICFEAMSTAEPWNGKTAAEYADEKTADYVAEDFGFRRFNREYIQADNGRIVRNPDYLRHYKAQPGLGAPWFWKVLFQWWMDNRATPEQLRILKACDALRSGWNTEPDWMLRKGGGEQATLVSYSIYYEDPTGSVEWDGKGKKASVMSWDEFAKLAKHPEAITP